MNTVQKMASFQIDLSHKNGLQSNVWKSLIRDHWLCAVKSFPEAEGHENVTADLVYVLYTSHYSATHKYVFLLCQGKILKRIYKRKARKY